MNTELTKSHILGSALVFRNICNYLNIEDISSLRKTCKRFKELIIRFSGINETALIKRSIEAKAISRAVRIRSLNCSSKKSCNAKIAGVETLLRYSLIKGDIPLSREVKEFIEFCTEDPSLNFKEGTFRWVFEYKNFLNIFRFELCPKFRFSLVNYIVKWGETQIDKIDVEKLNSKDTKIIVKALILPYLIVSAFPERKKKNSFKTPPGYSELIEHLDKNKTISELSLQIKVVVFLGFTISLKALAVSLIDS